MHSFDDKKPGPSKDTQSYLSSKEVEAIETKTATDIGQMVAGFEKMAQRARIRLFERKKVERNTAGEIINRESDRSKIIGEITSNGNKETFKFSIKVLRWLDKVFPEYLLHEFDPGKTVQRANDSHFERIRGLAEAGTKLESGDKDSQRIRIYQVLRASFPVLLEDLGYGNEAAVKPIQSHQLCSNRYKAIIAEKFRSDPKIAEIEKFWSKFQTDGHAMGDQARRLAPISPDPIAECLSNTVTQLRCAIENRKKLVLALPANMPSQERNEIIASYGKLKERCKHARNSAANAALLLTIIGEGFSMLLRKHMKTFISTLEQAQPKYVSPPKKAGK